MGAAFSFSENLYAASQSERGDIGHILMNISRRINAVAKIAISQNAHFSCLNLEIKIIPNTSSIQTSVTGVSNNLLLTKMHKAKVAKKRMGIPLTIAFIPPNNLEDGLFFAFIFLALLVLIKALS